MSADTLQSSQKKVDGNAVPAPQSGIVWLASYPKSGNTWTRAFLLNLVQVTSGEMDAQQINQLNQFSMGSAAIHFFEEILGFVPTNDHLSQTAAARARVQQHVADLVEGLIFVKTHQALVVDRGHTTINFTVTAGAIYIIRNPLDVAISYAHHLSQSIDATIDFMNRKNAETGTSEKQVYEVYGSWSQHVLSWTRKPHPAIYVMRYEDMLNEPKKTFGALARHLLFKPTEEQLADAIERSSFERLREQEEKDGFRERPEKAERFFREGRAGQWRDVLTPAQVQRIVDAHGEQMQRFGYLPL
ncbi:MAG TPA: sulfotransferase domain-containing protein [Terriglobia bacterium]|nr:sulfotransferase domain-containing protein [Terriglobia bacterium]